jgi:hypothetical protein
LNSEEKMGRMAEKFKRLSRLQKLLSYSIVFVPLLFLPIRRPIRQAL